MEQTSRFIINLGHVEYMTSDLVSTALRLKARGANIIFCNATNPYVRELFTAINLKEAIGIAESVEAACAELSSKT